MTRRACCELKFLTATGVYLFCSLIKSHIFHRYVFTKKDAEILKAFLQMSDWGNLFPVLPFTNRCRSPDTKKIFEAVKKFNAVDEFNLLIGQSVHPTR